MKARKLTPMGALHPVLFFAGVYVVALLFSIFICSSLFYSCHSKQVDVTKSNEAPSQKTAFVSTASAGAILH